MKLVIEDSRCMCLFMYRVNTNGEHDIYLRDKVDGLGQECVPRLQKSLAAIRMLPYEVYSDFIDEYIQLVSQLLCCH